MNFVKFKVTGGGDFPTDMLRYDRCFPRTSEDAANMKIGEFDRKTRRSVGLLTAWYRGGYHEPTIERWKSFGWEVTEVEKL